MSNPDIKSLFEQAAAEIKDVKQSKLFTIVQDLIQASRSDALDGNSNQKARIDRITSKLESVELTNEAD
jgi:hypothetical protein